MRSIVTLLYDQCINCVLLVQYVYRSRGSKSSLWTECVHLKHALQMKEFSDVFFVCVCVYAVFVIVSVDYLSVILPILKLTSSNVFRFRQFTMLTFLFVTKTVKYSSSFVVGRSLQTHFTSVHSF